MPKTFVLDTCVLVHDPDAIYEFAEHNVVIPIVVLEELDKNKSNKDNGELAWACRTALKTIKELRKGGKLSVGVSLGSGKGTLRIDSSNEEITFPGMSMKGSENDNLIMGAAFKLARETADPVILVTRDAALLLKADALGIDAEEYIGEAKNTSNDVGIIRELPITIEEFDNIHKAKGVGMGVGSDIPKGTCALLRAEGSATATILVRRKGDDLRIIDGKLKIMGLKHKNYEQSCLMDALMDKDVKMVICAGKAGSGKTLLSMAAGMQQQKDGQFDKVMITKSIEPVGADIGYVKGTKKDKMMEWLKPFYDNLELIWRRKPRNAAEEADLDEMIDNILEIDAITYIRGRSLMNRFVIVDEVQNLRPRITKTIVSRIHDSAKLIVLGDLEQIDSPYLDSINNGLTHMMNRLQGEDDVVILNLQRTERGRLAQLAIDNL